jgi:UDP-N-acetylmuramoyl-tripeptide--D-alanyl-D-alanine ligase
VLATAGNLNNDIGVPLTLLRMRQAAPLVRDRARHEPQGRDRLPRRHRAARVALVNNAQREHLEFMNSVEEVAAENAASTTRCRRTGVAVVNADDPHAPILSRPARARAAWSTSAWTRRRSDGAPCAKGLSSELRLRTPQGEAQATLAIPGCTTCATRSPRAAARMPRE